MISKQIIGICKKLDTMGYFKAADDLMQRVVTAQYIQPSNNMNIPIEQRVIPWREIEDTFKQRDYDWFKKSPTFRPQEYFVYPDTQEPPMFPSDPSVNESQTAEQNLERLQELLNIYKTYPLNPKDKGMILKQIRDLLNRVRQSDTAVGNPFDMHGPDSVPGPKNVIMDNNSPSMTGIDNFSWKNKKDVYNNPDDSYKQLMPNT